MRQVLILPIYRGWLAGRTASWIGDALLGLVLSMWVKTITGSSAQAAITFLFATIPYLLAPLAGLAIDRWPRRWVLILGNIFSMVALTPLLFVRSESQVPLVWLVTLLYGVSGVFLPAASQAIMRSIVSDELLGDANAVQSAVGNIVSLVCPAIGALLFAWRGGAAPVAAALIAFASAALLFVRLSNPPTSEPSHPSEAAPANISAGLRHVWRVKPLLHTSVALMIAQLGTGFLEGSIYSVTDAFDREPAWAAAIVLAQGVGLLAGSVLAGSAVRKFGEITSIKIAMAWTSLSILGAALAPTFWWLCGIAVLAGVGVPVVGVGAATLLQRLTPEGLMGRVQTATAPFVAVAAAFAMGVSAWLVSICSFRQIYPMISGLILLGLVHLARYTRRERRRARTTAR